MKKLFLLAIVALSAVTMNAQIIFAESSKVLYRSGTSSLEYKDSTYILGCKDYRSANYVYLKLGKSLEEATTSAFKLYYWYKGAKSEESVSIIQDNAPLTLYKASPTLLYISKADANTCRSTYQSIIKSVLVDEAFATGLIENTEPIGILSLSSLTNVCKTFQKIVKK